MIRRKYWGKKGRAKRDSIPFLLSREEYTQKIFEAGIKPNQISCKKGGYHLARRSVIGRGKASPSALARCLDGVKITDGDLPYSTCRFITSKENHAEKDQSYHQTMDRSSRDKSFYETKEYKEKISKVHKGNKNVLGKIHIHNPSTGEATMIPKDQQIPDGFIKGRGKLKKAA